MNLTKDAYLEIAKAADDETIVKMLSVNRNFRDDKFFKLVFEDKYPLLIKFKKDNESWKYFYLKMVMYIFKLKEQHDLDYIPSEKFDPEDFYKYIEEQEYWHFDWELEAAEYLEDVKDLNFVRNFLEKHGEGLDFNYLILRELKTTNLKRIKIFVDADLANNSDKKFYSPVYSESIKKAIDNENIELLKILILTNIRKHDLEKFIEYARENNKPLSEKYLLSRVK